MNNSRVDPLNDLLQRVVSRGAILFLGSGFSATARGLGDEDMPTAKNLAERISHLKGFDSEGDLRYTAERFLKSGGGQAQLIQMLRETFTVRSVEDHHKAIASAPWKRIYTTNYDLCFEQAAAQVGKLVETVDLSAKPAEYAAKNNICVHLNGSLNDLTLDTLENAFKLTTSSYLSSESFVTSRWYYPFKRDLDYSSAIVFVGYSMYDIEVQKILNSDPEYISKTFFITRSLKGGRDQFTLEQFGTILPIGTEAFGEEITKKTNEFEPEPEELILASLWEYEVDVEDAEIRDSDVDSFLMRGEVADMLIDAAVTSSKGAPLLIHRDDLNYAQDLLRSGSNLVITADFGNGKSAFLRALRTLLTLDGMSVFTADQADFHQHDDLDQIVQKGIKGFLLVDSYEQNIDLVKHFAELDSANIQLIASARTSVHERNRAALLELGISHTEIAINDLSTKEVESFVRIIDNVGYWGDRAALPFSVKCSVIGRDNHGQISMNLLALLSSPQIVSRVAELVSGLFLVPNHKDTIFAIALLAANDMPLNSSFIADIARNEAIYTAELRNNSGFKQLFHFNGTKITSGSSIFAISLISHQFSSSYIVDQLLKIVSSIGSGIEDVPEKHGIQKSLLRFSVVERLLPEKQRMQNLIRYYENLKREVPWLKSDPHFWLQYGMTQLTYKKYSLAQRYFDQAYAWAARKYNYHTVHIDTQQARLFLMQAISALDASTAFNLYVRGHQLLNKVPNDLHKYRQVESYKDVYRRWFKSFSKSNKVTFEHACRATLNELIRIEQENPLLSWSRMATRIEEQLKEILDEIKLDKGSS